MYKVYYYSTAGKKHNRVFPSLHEAVHFAVYKVSYGNCGEIIKVN